MTITKQDWDGLPAGILKDAFKPVEGKPDEYSNGEENAASLRNALENERTRRTEIGQQLDTLRQSQTQAIEEARTKALAEARTSGDFARIEADYKRQIEEANARIKDIETKELNARIASTLEGEINSILPNFTSSKIGRSVLQGLIRVEVVEGNPVVRYLDDNGQPTGLNKENFIKNLLADPELKASIRASNASGGGATNAGGGGGATPTKLSDFANGTEEAAFANAHPERYKAMLDAEQA